MNENDNKSSSASILDENIITGHIIKCIDSGHVFAQDDKEVKLVFQDCHDRLHAIKKSASYDEKVVEKLSILSALVESGSRVIQQSVFPSKSAVSIFAKAKLFLESNKHLGMNTVKMANPTGFIAIGPMEGSGMNTTLGSLLKART